MLSFFVSGPILLASLCSLSGAPEEKLHQVDRVVYSMGTRLRISVEGTTRRVALQASEQAIVAVHETEELLSTWSAGSPLSQFGNISPNSVLELSPDLDELLARVDLCQVATGGAFSLTPGEAGTGFNRLENNSFKRLGAGAFDSGAFGKGEALDRAIEAIKRTQGTRRIQLDFGGQITVSSAKRTVLRVDLAHPLVRDEPVLRLDLKALPQLSIATSGNSERGQQTSHIRDPRSGSAARNFGSLTVLAPSSFQADCLSTGFFVLGPQAALASASSHPDVGVIVLETTRDGDLIARTAGTLPGRLTALTPNLKILPFKGSEGQRGAHPANRSRLPLGTQSRSQNERN